jgi:glycosyltransferase involved in cell wall biosynthesis
LIDLVSTTRYIAISSEVKSSLIRYNGLSPDKIIIIPNAILSRRSGIISEFPAWLKEKLKNRKIIGMVAHMGPQKDHFSVIEAAKLVIQNIPSALFVLIGGNLVNDPADTRASYEKIVNNLKLNDYVLFVGETNDPYPYIEMFDIGILISHWEGFGNALVEYMLRKKPVIGTAVGGIKDIIIDGENGFLIPPERPDILAEKIIWLLNNPLEAGHMGERGFIRAQKEYSMDVWIKRISEMYSSVL